MKLFRMSVHAPTRLWTAAVAGLLLTAPAADGQVRGLPLFFDPTFSFDTRAGGDVGNGGELGGLVWSLGATRLFLVGNCKRLAVSAAGGLWHPPGDGADDGFNGGATVSYLVNACPEFTSQPNPTMRLVGGGGLTRAAGRTVWNAPVGAEIGYMLEVGVFKVEPWATLRAHWLESPVTDGRSTWRAGLSLGLNVGMGAKFGLRGAADFGTGRTGFGGGLSYWW
jgi:hypothetical protein